MTKPIEGKWYFVNANLRHPFVAKFILDKKYNRGQWCNVDMSIPFDPQDKYFPLELALHSEEMFEVLKKVADNDVPHVWFGKAQALITKIEEAVKS